MRTSASGEPAWEDEVCSMAGWRLGWVGCTSWLAALMNSATTPMACDTASCNGIATLWLVILTPATGTYTKLSQPEE